MIGNAIALAIMLGLQALFPVVLEDFELRLIDSRFKARQALGLAGGQQRRGGPDVAAGAGRGGPSAGQPHAGADPTEVTPA